MEQIYQSKPYRTVMALFPVAKNRKGNCINCGACCRLPVKCMFLCFDPDRKSYCLLRRKIGWYFLQCQKYPRTEKEWITQKKCGYWFE